jgi:hypothetical protein
MSSFERVSQALKYIDSISIIYQSVTGWYGFSCRYSVDGFTSADENKNHKNPSVKCIFLIFSNYAILTFWK